MSEHRFLLHGVSELGATGGTARQPREGTGAAGSEGLGENMAVVEVAIARADSGALVGQAGWARARRRHLLSFSMAAVLTGVMLRRLSWPRPLSLLLLYTHRCVLAGR